MDAKLYLDLFKIVAIIGAFLVLVGAFGSYHYGNKVDKKNIQELSKLKETNSDLKSNLMIGFEETEKQKRKLAEIENITRKDLDNQKIQLEELADNAQHRFALLNKLENKNKAEEAEKKQIEKILTTPPDVGFEVGVNKDNLVYVETHFHNNTPINLTTFVESSTPGGSTSSGLFSFKQKPNENNKSLAITTSNINQIKDWFVDYEVTLRYASIYAVKGGNLELEPKTEVAKFSFNSKTREYRYPQNLND